MLQLFAAASDAEPLGGASFAASLMLAVSVAASAAFFSWVARGVLRSGQRVETAPFAVFELILAAGWLGIFALMAFASSGASMVGDQAAAAFTTNQILTLGAFQITLYAIPLALLLHRRHDLVILFGLNNVSLFRALGWALAALFAFYPLMALMTILIQMFYQSPPPEQDIMKMIQATSGMTETFLLIVFAVVVAPICEEFFFRGLLYGSAKRFFGFPAAALLSAVSFALVHNHLPAIVPLAALGLVLVLIYERTGSLIVPMAMHALFNSVSLIASRFITPP